MAQLLGLRVTPVLVLGYDDPSVSVLASCVGETWDPEAVLTHERSQILLLNKTTLHIFAPEIRILRVALELLS